MLTAALLSPSGLPAQGNASPTWPEITRESKPWTRWWWHGSAVTEEGLTEALERYAAVGLGGVEITPIYGVHGRESAFVPYLSPRWMELLTHTLAEAERLGLGVDMATGTGWPFGGPWVGEEIAPKYVVRRTYRLRGGERLEEPVEYLQEPLVRAVGNQVYETYGIYRMPGEHVEGTRERPPEIATRGRIEIEDLVEPITANADLQSLALDQVRFRKPLPLVTLIGYGENGEVVDLTDEVRENGVLDWTAPAGEWTLQAIFQGWHGKQVERAAPGGEGHVIDHFSRTAITEYLTRFDGAFGSRGTGTLRGFFNDSYEVDDATGQADWTPLFLQEFVERRGYDLREHLPALFGEGEDGHQRRVLADYRETVSDLILERFTEPWADWARRRGTLVRNQAHGSPGNILDLYAASDVPETEGTDLLRIKFASSAANVGGRRLASSEAATWLGEHFQSTLADVKWTVDRYLVGGINHIVYHGTAYSPVEEEWPGWLFYASVHFTPANPWWDDLSALNGYVARAQAFLQDGVPDNDVLLYYPVHDRFARRGAGLLEHFDGNPADEVASFRAAAEALLDGGFAFDYVSDRQIQASTIEGGEIRTAGGGYRVVVVPAAEFVPVETVEQLIRLARGGAAVVFAGGLPRDVPGLHELEARRARLRDLLSEIPEAAGGSASESAFGEGRLVRTEAVDRLPTSVSAVREPMADLGLRFVRRRAGDEVIYFIHNPTEDGVDGWVPLATGGPAATIYDPLTGEEGIGRSRGDGEAMELLLQLGPGESRIVRVSRHGGPRGSAWRYLRPVGEPAEVNGSWEVSFESGGPVLPASLHLDELRSWTEAGGGEAAVFSGTAVYRTRFLAPSGDHDGPWALDLGQLHESAQVRLNGVELGTSIGPPHRFVVEADQIRSENELEVRVTNLMANRIAEMDRQGSFWKRFYNVNFPARLRENRDENGLFDASGWEPRPSGLIGPVTLSPLELY